MPTMDSMRTGLRNNALRPFSGCMRTSGWTPGGGSLLRLSSVICRQITEDSRSKLPPPGVHPLVRMHPENGRKALFLNPVRMESIVGMEDKEALALIDELMRHATQKKYEYRHKWRHGD